MKNVTIKILSYPNEEFVKESWGQGGKGGFIDDLLVFWHSPIEIIINGYEILKSVIDNRWKDGPKSKGLAIPLDEFWTIWIKLLEGIQNRTEFMSPSITVGEGFIDDLSIKAINNRGIIKIELIDTKNNKILSSAQADYQSLISATKECRQNAINKLVQVCLDSGFVVNKDDFNSDAFLVDLK